MCTCECKRFILQCVSQAGVPINKWAPRGDRDKKTGRERRRQRDEWSARFLTGNKCILIRHLPSFFSISRECTLNKRSVQFLLPCCQHTHVVLWGGCTLHPLALCSWNRPTCYHTVQPTTCMGTLSTTYIPADLHIHTQTAKRQVSRASNLTSTQTKSLKIILSPFFFHTWPGLNYFLHQPSNRVCGYYWAEQPISTFSNTTSKFGFNLEKAKGKFNTLILFNQF